MWWAPSAMAEAHVRLHRLPVEGLQPPRQPFLDRSLEDLGSVLADCGLRGLGAGYRWLADHRPLACEPPSLLHLDFHPDNVVMRQGRCQAVLDWSEADVGDRHADIGATLFLIEAAPVPRSTAWQDGLVPLGRWILRRRYLRAYRRLLAVDDERVRFYRAWAALRRLATYGCWLRSGPRAAGYQPEALARLHRRDVAAAEKYFHRWTGVSVRLGHTRGLL
jgi:aminoglycoside phosphotransferase (APT) family kinase protein